jgi:uncharacterized protein (DUF58 family)
MVPPSRSKKPRKSPKPNFWQWLESRYCLPEFGGSMLLGLAIFFFISATNTLAGWLYVISGVSFALILIGAVMPARALKKLVVKRSPIEPVSAGENVWVEIQVTNRGSGAADLIWLREAEPLRQKEQSSKNPQAWQFDRVFEHLEPNETEFFNYQLNLPRRGIYQFQRLQLLTSSPLGLFRSLRFRDAPQDLIVYPQVLPLSQCPLLDRVGQEDRQKVYSLNREPRNANEGMTKTIRSYRWGDPTRLIHWRSSARLGELRVRELEVNLGGQEVAIALDLNSDWQDRDFEQAVIAAASLYFYAQSANLEVKLWTVTDGLIQGDRQVLETLAATYSQNLKKSESDFTLPSIPLVWLTAQADSCSNLSEGSSWILWTQELSSIGEAGGLVIAPPDRDLSEIEQLQI